MLYTKEQHSICVSRQTEEEINARDITTYMMRITAISDE
jgi:hypothetical protein